ncbi:MAG: O-antigen ligase family protein [Patescibacteria group bacterium]
MDIKTIIPGFIKWALLATALAPLIVSNATIYPFVFPKIVFYRVLVEFAFILSLAYIILIPKGEFKERFAARSPVIVFLALFFLSLVVSALLAENVYRAFWGDIERGVGIFGFLHFYVFLILAMVFFKSVDWERFFKLSLIVGFLLIGFAFLEYFGWRFLFLNPPQKPRPESLIGNPAFFATHLIFLSAFGFLVFKKAGDALKKIPSPLGYFWKYFSVSVSFLAIMTIFMTGTRGAILGIGIGFLALLVYFAVRKESLKWLRFISVAAILVSIIFALAFWQTRGAEFWQKIPGLDRLAKTAVLDVDDPSTQFRLITWKLSWKAFKEKPIFGWGPENYIVAYEKYYDPDYALYGETWLDRAHNTFFDVLVMQGLFGVFAYLGLILSVIYVIFKKIVKQDFYLAAVFFAGVVAYFVQNLVIFDQIVSYAVFFSFIGYIAYFEKSEEFPFSPVAAPAFVADRKYELIVKGVSVFVILIAIYSVAAHNLIPYNQGIAFKKSPSISANVFDVEGAVKRAIYPYNFAQYGIRVQGIDTVYSDAYFNNEEYVSNPKFRPLGETLVKMIGELVELEPYDVRIHIRLVEMLNGFSRGMTEEEISKTKIYEAAEKLMREAAKRAPKRQEVYYHLAFNLAAQKKFDEAAEVAQYAIDLQPKVARANYHLGLVLALAGKNEESQKAIAKAEELAPNFERFMGTDINNIAIFYKTWGLADKYAELIYRTLLKINENKIGHIFGRADYEDALRYYLFNKNAERAVLIADYLGKKFPELSGNMAEIKQLLEKNDEKSVPVIFPREYYENELRRYVLVKDKSKALEMARYLLKNHREYALDVGIDVIMDLIEKEKWEILHKL